MLLDVDAEQICHQSQLWPLLAELLSLDELFTVHKNLDSFVVHLFLDQ